MGKAADHARDVLKKHVNDSGKVKSLAHALGVHPSTVYNWRSGERGLGPDEIASLARYLHMTADQLLGLEPPPEAPPPIDPTKLRRLLLKAATAIDDVAEALPEEG